MEALLLLFKTKTITSILIIGAVILSMMILIYVISIIFNKPIYLAIGPIKLNLGNKVDKSGSNIMDTVKTIIGFNNEKLKSQTFVDNIRDVTAEKTEDKDIIQLRETVTRQMLAAEEYNIKIKSILTEKYADFLRTKLEKNKDVKQHKDYRYYQVILSNILDDIKRTTLKATLKSTNIIALSDIEFDDFVDKKTELMLTIVRDYIDFMYSTNSIVTRDEVHKINQTLQLQIKNVINDLYKNIKIIILEDKKSIEKIDKQLQKEISVVKERFDQNSSIGKIKKVIFKDNNENI